MQQQHENHEILGEVWVKYEEHLEMLKGPELSLAIITIMSNMIKDERDKVIYYRKLLCKD